MSRLFKIAAREYVAYVRTIGFWASMLLMPVISGFAIGAPAWLEHSAPPQSVAVFDLTDAGYRASVVEALQSGPGRKDVNLVTPEAPPGEALQAAIRRWMTDGVSGSKESKLSAAAIIRGSGDAVTLEFWSSNLTDTSLQRRIGEAIAEEMQSKRLAAIGVDQTQLRAAQALKPTVETFSPRSETGGKVSLRDRIPGLVGFAAAFMLWAIILTGAGILLNSVIEEKSNRVLEVLLASASAPEIVAGKILGVACVTLTVLAVWASVGGTVLTLSQPAIAADVAAVLMQHGLIFYFLFYLVGGYLLYASVFIAIGAFCETTREAQTLLGPVMGLLTIPLIFLSQAIRRPDSPLLEALSWFPPFTPFLMTARAAGSPPLWQVAGTGALMIATVVLAVWIGGRAFRVGALTTGKVDLKGLIARIRRAEA